MHLLLGDDGVVTCSAKNDTLKKLLSTVLKNK